MYNFNNQWIREESDWFAYFNESDQRNCTALFCRFSHASVELAIFRRQIALPQFKVIQLVRFTKRKPQSLLRTLRAMYTRDCRMPLLKSKSCWLIARLEGLFSCAQSFYAGKRIWGSPHLVMATTRAQTAKIWELKHSQRGRFLL